MALSGIDLPLTMRLWHSYGLQGILSDPETVARACSPTHPAPTRDSITPRPVSPPSSPPLDKSRKRPSFSRRYEQSVSSPSPQPQTKAPNQPLSQKTPELAPSLKAYFSRLTIPAFSLWTYWELAEDLGQTPNTARQMLLKKMLHALAWPPGSSVFWPMSRLEGEALQGDMDLFTFGIKTITPVYVFCFGEQGCRLLAPDKDPAPLQRMASPHIQAMIQPLPDLNAMLPNNRELKSIAWKILKSYTPMPM